MGSRVGTPETRRKRGAKKVRSADHAFIYTDIGTYRTTSLFTETAHMSGSSANANPVYTFAPKDVGDIKSAHKMFMESANEYQAAIKMFGTWAAWEHITESPTLRPYFVELRKAKAAKEFYEIKQVLYDAAVNDGNITAASKLFEHYNKQAKGRPSNQKIKQAAKELAKDESIIEHANKVVRELKRV